MDYLTKKYKEKCKEIFSELGFKIYRNTFYRVVNDVYQSFSLHKSVSGGDCTVEFIVAPLCVGDHIYKGRCGPDHLKKFESTYAWFYYNRYDISSMDHCVDEMIGYMKKYLIPHFKSSEDSYQAYFTKCEFQKNHYRTGLLLQDYDLYHMALKAKLYDKCIEHLIAQREDAEHAYEHNKKMMGEHLPPDYGDRIRKEVEEINGEIKMISENDFESIQKYINENEAKALSNLGIKFKH